MNVIRDLKNWKSKLEISVFASIKNSSVHPLRQVRRLANKQASKPVFEMLEERQHFSIVTVTTTADSGTGSLRSAIQAVDAGKDNTIDFDIPTSQESGGLGMWMINVKSALPTLTKPALIDGTSQPSYQGPYGPRIDLNGSETTTAVVGLEATGGNTTIRGLSIGDFSTGVEFSDSTGGDLVKGCELGNYAGTNRMATDILLDSPHSTATGNIIYLQQSTYSGIQAAGSYDSVSNNNINGFDYSYGVGVDVEGVEPSGGGFPSNVTGVTVANNAINTIGTGVCSDNFTNDNTISGNTIDDADTGILVENYSSNNTLTNNVVTSSNLTGISVLSSYNTIGKVGSGNTVTESFGTGTCDGIDIYGGYNSIIGNTSSDNAGAGLVISYIDGADNFAVHNTVQDNTLDDNQGPGVVLGNDASNNLIGGTSTGQGNVITGPDETLNGANIGSFVDVSVDSTASSNEILGNSISDSPGSFGISGTSLPEAPTISAAVAPIAGAATITGTVHSTAFTTVRVELFASPAESSQATPLDNEGATYLGYVNVTTNLFGNATYSTTVARTPGEVITATATSNGTTSEFSKAVTETRLSVIVPRHI